MTDRVPPDVAVSVYEPQSSVGRLFLCHCRGDSAVIGICRHSSAGATASFRKWHRATSGDKYSADERRFHRRAGRQYDPGAHCVPLYGLYDGTIKSRGVVCGASEHIDALNNWTTLCEHLADIWFVGGGPCNSHVRPPDRLPRRNLVALNAVALSDIGLRRIRPCVFIQDSRRFFHRVWSLVSIVCFRARIARAKESKRCHRNVVTRRR